MLRSVFFKPDVHLALRRLSIRTGIPGPLLIGQMVEEGIQAMAITKAMPGWLDRSESKKKPKPAPKQDPKKKSPPKKPKRKK